MPTPKPTPTHWLRLACWGTDEAAVLSLVRRLAAGWQLREAPGAVRQCDLCFPGHRPTAAAPGHALVLRHSEPAVAGADDELLLCHQRPEAGTTRSESVRLPLAGGPRVAENAANALRATLGPGTPVSRRRWSWRGAGGLCIVVDVPQDPALPAAPPQLAVGAASPAFVGPVVRCLFAAAQQPPWTLVVPDTPEAEPTAWPPGSPLRPDPARRPVPPPRHPTTA